jgi:hypothetical protein
MRELIAKWKKRLTEVRSAIKQTGNEPHLERYRVALKVKLDAIMECIADTEYAVEKEERDSG